MADTLPVKFHWNTFRPDQREYRQQSLELEPTDATIQIDVPNDPVYFAHSDSEDRRTILTLAGLRYVIDQFDTVFLPSKPAPVELDEDWEKEGEVTASKSDDWEEDTDFDAEKETDKVPWNDDGKDWE